MGEKEIKCVGDLDNTIWDGILLESDDVQLKPGSKKLLRRWTAENSSFHCK